MLEIHSIEDDGDKSLKKQKWFIFVNYTVRIIDISLAASCLSMSIVFLVYFS